MPTNLKSLLNRSRSRNELKLREKGDESGTGNGTGAGTGAVVEHSSGCSESSSGFPATLLSSESGLRRDGSSKSFFSCSALHGVGLELTEGEGEGGRTTDSHTNTNTTGCLCHSATPVSQKKVPTSVSQSQSQSLSIRKCETVLALSTFTGSPSTSATSPATMATTTTTPGDGGGHPSPGSPLEPSSGRVKVMKDRIFSTSSSTLNSLIHSSNRTTSKFFAGWKFSGNSGSSNGHSHPSQSSTSTHEISQGGVNATLLLSVGPSEASPFTVAALGGGKKSKSQLSISDSGNGGTPMTPVNRLRRNVSVNNSYCCFSNNPALCGPYSRSSSVTSFTWKEDGGEIFCRLCLSHFNIADTVQLDACACRYCKDCLVAYTSFEIQEGAYEIACPDASCDKEGVLTLAEIENLIPNQLMEKHRKFRLYREVEKDAEVMWCPSPGCETVCLVESVGDKCRAGVSTTSITCTTCSKTFCAECKLPWHPDTSCESFRRKLVKAGKLSVDDEELYSIESIKKCPFCHVPIEKDSGCAQMMCKRCKHVFCWYCLASLDDDFLLRHYDKGPCKNKLGHSRASVVWHRAQVIGIFAGFGVLVLLASPLLILAAPCLLCCRCRYCANKLDPEDPISL